MNRLDIAVSFVQTDRDLTLPSLFVSLNGDLVIRRSDVLDFVPVHHGDPEDGEDPQTQIDLPGSQEVLVVIMVFFCPYTMKWVIPGTRLTYWNFGCRPDQDVGPGADGIVESIGWSTLR